MRVPNSQGPCGLKGISGLGICHCWLQPSGLSSLLLSSISVALYAFLLGAWDSLLTLKFTLNIFGPVKLKLVFEVSIMGVSLTALWLGLTYDLVDATPSEALVDSHFRDHVPGHCGVKLGIENSHFLTKLRGIFKGKICLCKSQ